MIAKTDFEVLSEYKGGTGRVLSVYLGRRRRETQSCSAFLRF